jgi:hypothetical protein
MNSKPVTLDQSVVNPVGSGENTDQGEKHNAPSQVNSHEVCIVPGVCNPVANERNTGPSLL